MLANFFKSFHIFLFFLALEVPRSAAARVGFEDDTKAVTQANLQAASNQDTQRGEESHIGFEVELADGLIERKLGPSRNELRPQKKNQKQERHPCSKLLDYGSTWFVSQSKTLDLEEDWNASLPLFQIESEVYERNTAELVTGPMLKLGAVQVVEWIVKLSKSLRGKTYSLSGPTSLRSILETATGLTMVPGFNTTSKNHCGKRVWIKAEKAILTAGVQVNFEMKLSQVPKLIEDDGYVFSYFGQNDLSAWRGSKICLEEYLACEKCLDQPAADVSRQKKGALLLAFHQAAVVALCEKAKHDTACKKGTSLLAKTTIDPASAKTGSGRSLVEVTGKTWEDLKQDIKDNNLRCAVPEKVRPDDKMFSKAQVPGLGGSDPADPIVVMEARSGGGGIASAFKAVLREYEGSNKLPENDPRPIREFKAQIDALQKWAFTNKANSELVSTVH